MAAKLIEQTFGPVGDKLYNMTQHWSDYKSGWYK